ncbi:hypothetical protein [Streptomyces benahoarensis]|uniref:Lipoprotein n=1 Tax=Streptomyces benahoarensis TaxID=2595054 RepID=A0A553YZV5_9ACTN|nr:hypothetical protein [Streptomyces benahoarensis]TSB18460.1 hypothetical protein FNJ62_24195 [Streptomyces benahoarensis]TSB34729.1 hypothetical protein FNZ23_21970 [Streptomyces benahoarensis]
MSTHTTARTARRRTLRVALAALTAVAGLTLTACSGGDAADAKPAGHAAAAQSGGAGSSAGVADSHAKSGSGAKSGSEAKAETKSDAAVDAADEAGAPDNTVTLEDGSTAEIYDLGNQNYRAKIVNGGDVLATLETKDTDAGADLNGMYVVLTLGGEVHSWMGGEQTGPGTFTLEGGWKAKVTKLGELHYRAEILGEDGSVNATVEADENDAAGLDANGIYIVLTAGGQISSHE